MPTALQTRAWSKASRLPVVLDPPTEDEIGIKGRPQTPEQGEPLKYARSLYTKRDHINFMTLC